MQRTDQAVFNTIRAGVGDRFGLAGVPVLMSLLAGIALGACSQSKEPSIEVSDLTIAQYRNTCAGCHDAGLGGAPITGDSADWAQRAAKGMGKVRENAIVGFEGATGIMPARGGGAQLSDEEVDSIVDYMVDVSR